MAGVGGPWDSGGGGTGGLTVGDEGTVSVGTVGGVSGRGRGVGPGSREKPIRLGGGL